MPIFRGHILIVASIPLAFRVGTGSELHRPLAVVYIGGFIGAIVVRMVAMPVLYEVVAAGRRTKAAWDRRVSAGGPGPGPGIRGMRRE